MINCNYQLMEHGIYEPTNGREYTTFKSLILQAASERATKLKHENKVWFKHSLATLLPIITDRENLLHLLLHTDPSNYDSIRDIKHDLKLAQNNVTDSIDLDKARWSAFQAARIHKMRFTPKQAWKGVKILVGGKESHHIKPVVMRPVQTLPSNPSTGHHQSRQPFTLTQTHRSL